MVERAGRSPLSEEQAAAYSSGLDDIFGGVAKIGRGTSRLMNLAPDLGVPAILGLSHDEWVQRRMKGQAPLSVKEREAGR